MNNEQMLIAQSTRLTTLRHMMEEQRAAIGKLLEEGHQLSSDIVVAAARNLETISAEWYKLKAEYLELRNKVSVKRQVLQ